MKVLWICAMVVLTTAVFGQSTTEADKKIWFSLGLGSYRAHQIGGIAGSVSVDFATKNQYWKARYLHADEFSILGPSPQERYDELGVMYGWVSKPGEFRFSIAGGVGFLDGTKRVASSDPSTYGSVGDHFFTFGIPCEAQISWTPTRHFAIGLSAFADLNPQASLTGLALKFEFGRVR